MMVRTLKAATTIGASLPFGPVGRPVTNDTMDKDMNRHQLYNLFVERMEDEVAMLVGAEGKARVALGGRAKGPQFVIKSVLGDNDGGARRTTAVSRAWRRSAKWLTTLAGQPGRKPRELR